MRPCVAKNLADHGCGSDAASLAIEPLSLGSAVGWAENCLFPEPKHNVRASSGGVRATPQHRGAFRYSQVQNMKKSWIEFVTLNIINIVFRDGRKFIHPLPAELNAVVVVVVWEGDFHAARAWRCRSLPGLPEE